MSTMKMVKICAGVHGEDGLLNGIIPGKKVRDTELAEERDGVSELQGPGGLHVLNMRS